MEEPLLIVNQGTEAFKRKEYKYRIVEFKVRKKYFKKLEITLAKRIIYTSKPLIVGLIPKKKMEYYKKEHI